MKSNPVSRREFLEQTSAAAALAGTALLPNAGLAADESGNNVQVRAAGNGKNVALICDPADTIAAAAEPSCPHIPESMMAPAASVGPSIPSVPRLAMAHGAARAITSSAESANS